MVRYDAIVEIDRWVVPPAVAAAFFAVVAVAPPVSREGAVDGLRVELAGPVRADGLALVRVAVETVADASLRAPRALIVEATDGAGNVTATAAGEPLASTPWRVARVRPPAGASRFVLRVRADGRVAGVSLPVNPATPASEVVARVEEVDLAATAGVLLPEQRGEVLVRVPGAEAVRLEPEFDGVAVEPAEAATGACDVAAFQVTVSGMGAPVIVAARMRDGTAKRWSRRLPLHAGGLALVREGDEIVVRGTLAGRVAYLLGGDGDALTWWSAVTLAPSGDDALGRAPLPREAPIGWVRASLDARMGDEFAPFTRWGARAEACATDAPSRRWFGARGSAPAAPDVRVVFDGAARAKAAMRARVSKARAFALACLAAAIALESVVVLGLGMRTPDGEVSEVMRTRRERLGPLLSGVALLLLVGFALGLASLVGAAWE